MFIMYANHKRSRIRKVPANLDKHPCVYFKVKNKLGMFDCWCKIKPKQQKQSLLSLF